MTGTDMPIGTRAETGTTPARASVEGPWRRLVAASAVSSLGDGVHIVAFPLLASTLTSNAAAIAAVATAATAPTLLFALPVGGLVDRVDRGRLMVGADLARAALLAVLVIAVLTDTVALWHLFVIAFVLGVGEILFNTASSAFVPSVVEAASLPKVNGYQSAVAELGNGVVGPAVGGAVFAAAACLPFAANGLSFTLAALLIMPVAWSRRQVPPPPEPLARVDTGMRRFAGEIGEGIGWVLRHRGLRALAVVLCAWNLFGWMPEGTLVLYATRELGIGSGGFGILFGASSVGAVIGGLLSGRLVSRLGTGPTLLLSVGVYAALLFPPALLTSPVAAGVVFFLQGLPLLCWASVVAAAVQTIVPDRLLGRVGSVLRLVGGGMTPLGLLLGGVVADRWGLRSVFVVAGAGLTAAFLCNIRGLLDAAARMRGAVADAGPVEAGP